MEQQTVCLKNPMYNPLRQSITVKKPPKPVEKLFQNQENLCLRRPLAEMVPYFATCSKAKTFTNLVFVCRDGYEVFGHKLLVLPVCKNLRSLLQSQQLEETAVVVLPDFDSETVQQLMGFVYTGKVEFRGLYWFEQFKELRKILGVCCDPTISSSVTTESRAQVNKSTTTSNHSKTTESKTVEIVTRKSYFEHDTIPEEPHTASVKLIPTNSNIPELTTSLESSVSLSSMKDTQDKQDFLKLSALNTEDNFKEIESAKVEDIDALIEAEALENMDIKDEIAEDETDLEDMDISGNTANILGLGDEDLYSYPACHFCGKDFEGPLATAAHILKTHRDLEFLKLYEENSSVCHLCPDIGEQGFKSFKFHLGVFHRKVLDHLSPEYSANLEEALNNEMLPEKVAAGLGKNLSLCYSCGQLERRYSQMLHHLTTSHHSQPFKDLFDLDEGNCRVCDTKFSNKQSFTIHLGVTHEKVLDYLPEEIKTLLVLSSRDDQPPQKSVAPPKRDQRRKNKNNASPSMARFIAGKKKEKILCPLCKKNIHSASKICGHLAKTHYIRNYQRLLRENKGVCPNCGKKFGKSPSNPKVVYSYAAHLGGTHQTVLKFLPLKAKGMVLDLLNGCENKQ